jgi:hypothetical protein
MDESKITDMNMIELSKMIDELDKDILKIKIPELPKPNIPRLKIIEQQLKYHKERLVYYETMTYRNSVSKEKAIEDVHDATVKFRFFIEQKEIELEKES